MKSILWQRWVRVLGVCLILAMSLPFAAERSAHAETNLMWCRSSISQPAPKTILNDIAAISDTDI